MEIANELIRNSVSEYLTPKELANKLGMSLKWVEKQTYSWKIPGQIKIGRLWRYKRIDVEKALLKRHFLLEEPIKTPIISIGRVRFPLPAQGTHCSGVRNGY